MCAGVTEGQVLESRPSYSLCRVNYSSGGEEDTLLGSFVYNREGVGEVDSPPLHFLILVWLHVSRYKVLLQMQFRKIPFSSKSIMAMFPCCILSPLGIFLMTNPLYGNVYEGIILCHGHI